MRFEDGVSFEDRSVRSGRECSRYLGFMCGVEEARDASDAKTTKLGKLSRSPTEFCGARTLVCRALDDPL